MEKNSKLIFIFLAICLFNGISNAQEEDDQPADTDYFDPEPEHAGHLCINGFVYHQDYCYSWSNQEENMHHEHVIPTKFTGISKTKINSSEFENACNVHNTHQELNIGIANFDREDELKNIELAFKAPNETVTEYYVKYHDKCAVITFKDNNLSGPETPEDCGINQKYFICRYRLDKTTTSSEPTTTVEASNHLTEQSTTESTESKTEGPETTEEPLYTEDMWHIGISTEASTRRFKIIPTFTQKDEEHHNHNRDVDSDHATQTPTASTPASATESTTTPATIPTTASSATLPTSQTTINRILESTTSKDGPSERVALGNNADSLKLSSLTILSLATATLFLLF